MSQVLSRRRWILVGASAVIAVLMAILVVMVSPQDVTVCASGCSFSQIQSALDAVRAGSTLHIQPGTYRENLQIAKRVQLIGSEGAVLEGQITIAQAKNVSITALTVRGAVQIEESRNVVITKSTISESPDVGVSVISSRDISLIENAIVGNAGDGVRVQGATVRLSRNMIGGNKGYGIAADGASQLSGDGNRNGYRVPGDFQTIQEAIDAWAAGMGINGLGDVNENVPKELLTGDGVIFVAPGIYKERLTIRDKNIRIRGADRDSVIVDGTGLGDVDGITLRGTTKAFIENMTVRNFRDDGIDAEGQIELTLRNMILEGNGSTGIEVAHTDVKVWLTKSIIRNNRTYGLWALSAQNIVECRSTTVTGNTNDYGGLGGSAAVELAQKCQ